MQFIHSICLQQYCKHFIQFQRKLFAVLATPLWLCYISFTLLHAYMFMNIFPRTRLIFSNYLPDLVALILGFGAQASKALKPTSANGV